MITMKPKGKQETFFVIDKKSSAKLTWQTLRVVFFGKYVDENQDQIFGIYGWELLPKEVIDYD